MSVLTIQTPLQEKDCKKALAEGGLINRGSTGAGVCEQGATHRARQGGTKTKKPYTV